MNKHIVFIIAAILGYFYKPDPVLDLFRYYKSADSIDANVSMYQFVFDTFNYNIDFIYFTFFLIFKKIGIAKEFVTAIFVGMFYSQLMDFMKNSKNLFYGPKNDFYVNVIYFYTILSVTPIIILSISRNVAALAFLFLGINLLLKNKKKHSAILFLISIFTHVGIILYISVFYISYFFKPLRINNKIFRNTILVISTIIGFSSTIWIDTVLSLLTNSPFFKSFTRYTIYTTQDMTMYGNLSYYDIIPIYFFTLLLLLNLMLIDRYTNIVWVAYYSYIFMAISIGYSVMFTQRSLMFLMPFQGLAALIVVKENNTDMKLCMVYCTILFYGTILSISNIYSYRVMLFGT